MVRSGLRLTALALLAALVAIPAVDLAFAGGDPPTSSPPATSPQKGKKLRQSLFDPTSTPVIARPMH